jgi:hypothetical protein
VLQRSNTTTLNKSGEGDVHKIDLSFLLNLLDGVLEMPGRIVIMTSNFPDVLDTALVRPGRIDIIAKFTCCSFNTVIKMLEFFYDTSLTDEQRESIRETGEFKITPAEMSRIMFENFANIDGAIAKYKEFSGALDKQQQVESLNDSPCDNSTSEVLGATVSTLDATANTVSATKSTVGATVSTDEFSKPHVIYPDAARNEFYQKYLDDTADEFAKHFVKNDDGTISVSKDATADESYEKKLADAYQKKLADAYQKRLADPYQKKLEDESFQKELKEFYYKTSPDYFNNNKHILCSPLPLECLLKESQEIYHSQETYSTLDTGVLSGASAYES